MIYFAQDILDAPAGPIAIVWSGLPPAEFAGWLDEYTGKDYAQLGRCEGDFEAAWALFLRFGDPSVSQRWEGTAAFCEPTPELLEHIAGLGR